MKYLGEKSEAKPKPEPGSVQAFHGAEREADLLKVCRGVIEHHERYDYDRDGYRSTTCNYCEHEEIWEWQEQRPVKHKPNCIFLIAQDLLTGFSL